MARLSDDAARRQLLSTTSIVRATLGGFSTIAAFLLGAMLMLHLRGRTRLTIDDKIGLTAALLTLAVLFIIRASRNRRAAQTTSDFKKTLRDLYTTQVKALRRSRTVTFILLAAAVTAIAVPNHLGLTLYLRSPATAIGLLVAYVCLLLVNLAYTSWRITFLQKTLSTL